jgi:peroxiredoxin
VSSVALNLYQTRKIRELSGGLNDPLAEGSQVAPLTVKDLDGRAAVLESSNLPVILYFFSENCQWCESNARNVNLLEEQTRGRYRLFGISLSNENLPEYVKRHGFGFPVYLAPPADGLLQYKLKGTPKTVIVASNGQVMKAWTGAYTGTQKDSIEDFLDVRLPDA